MKMTPQIDQVDTACCEITSVQSCPKDGQEWELFTESHGVTIYRHYIESSGLYEYKIYGVLDDVPPETCVQVYMDLEYRKQWDSYVNELKEFEDPDGKKGVYWQINFPSWLFMSNRDYVFKRELTEIEHSGQQIWVISSSSQEYTSQPERRSVIRVTDFLQTMAITTDGKVGTKSYMHYYDNPKGNIPTMLINWAASSGVPGFLSQMQTACRGYPEYLRNKQNRR